MLIFISQGPVISMDMQLQNHQNTASRIAKILGNSEESAAKHLSKCIYSVGIGNNDYINNYLLPQFYPTNSSYTPDQYATVLIQQYSLQLKVSISNSLSLSLKQKRLIS